MKNSNNNQGRPRAVINWPDGEFTVKDILEKTGLTYATVSKNVKEALDNKVICVYSKCGTRGCPARVFKKLALVNPVAASVVENAISQ